MNESIINKTSEYFKNKGIILPTISELANPHIINEEFKDKLKTLDKNSVDPLNYLEFIGLIIGITLIFQKYQNILFYQMNSLE